MNKKLILSLALVTLAAAAIVGGTVAFFSDTETSTGNSFTAGSIDLLVDSEQHFNHMVCVKNQWQPEANYTPVFGDYPVAGTPCGGTWGQPDGLNIVNEKFFDFIDIKPGDSGENTVSLHVVNNDAYICAYVANLVNNDNGWTEPEGAVDTTDGVGAGELQDNILMTVWRDNGNDPSDPTNPDVCDNVQQSDEFVYVNDVPIDSNTGGWLLGHIAGDKTVCLGVSWEVPTTVGNIVQTDSVTGDISFYAEQYRNNPNFTCPPLKTITRIDRTQVGFGDGGWAGWSCPAGTTAVSGGIDSSDNPVGPNGLAVSGATIGGSTYPIFPHYTFPAGETGYVVQDLPDGSGNTISFHVDCQAN